jgi:cytochrome P450
MIENPIGVFEKHIESLGETFVFYFGGVKRAIVTSNPTVMQHVLKTNCENYQKSEIQTKRMGHFLGEGLLTTHGEVWRTQRRLIQRGFKPNQLTPLAAIMQESLDDSMSVFQNRVGHGPVDIYNELMRITFRMVARSLFSARMKNEDVDFISRGILSIQEFMVRQIVQPYLDPWFWLSGELRKHERTRTRGDQIVLDYILRRRRETASYQDLLQILLDARYSDGEGMSDQAVLSESMQLLVAGHETSSNALSWTLYLLSRHPEHIRNIREEFNRVVGRAPIQFSDLPNLELTAQVIEESLRLYPPFWMVDRVALSEDSVGDITIPRRSAVIVFIYGVHHSGKIWQDPAVFNPARFNRDNKKTHKAFTHIPFGGGPRGCIGQHYAMLQMVMILRAILSRYDMELAPDQTVVAQPMIILRPKNGIYMSFTQSKELDPAS